MQAQVPELVALVTGGSGFIGSELIRALGKQNIRVKALLRPTSNRRNLLGCEYQEAIGSLQNIESLKAAVRGVDIVFHVAGTIAGASDIYFSDNALGSENLAKACVEANPNLKRFVYVSSLAASGPAENLHSVRTEELTEKPVSLYGKSKLEGEKRILSLSKGIFPVSIVRPPVVYGPRDRGIFEFIRIVNRGLIPILKAQTGEKHYSVVHVEDIVDGIIRAGLQADQSEQEVFFICDDSIYSWSEFMGAISHGLGKSRTVRLSLPRAGWYSAALLGTVAGKITKKTFPLNLDKLKDLSPDYWICSNERAKKQLRFSPKYNLESGMAQTVAWYKQHGWI